MQSSPVRTLSSGRSSAAGRQLTEASERAMAVLVLARLATWPLKFALERGEKKLSRSALPADTVDRARRRLHTFFLAALPGGGQPILVPLAALLDHRAGS